jgi:hypothetical protein
MTGSNEGLDSVVIHQKNALNCVILLWSTLEALGIGGMTLIYFTKQDTTKFQHAFYAPK